MNVFKELFKISTLTLLLAFSTYSQGYSQNEDIKKEILNNAKIIRKAFSDGDIEKIKTLHHPNVIKALSYTDLKIGRDDVIKGIAGILKNYNMEFIKSEVENMLIQDNIVVVQEKFSLKGTSKSSTDSFIFSGRSVVTYIRYDKSPTGWATIREVIQQATE